MDDSPNEYKFKPGMDYQTICFLADFLDDEYKARKNSVIIPGWAKRFSFDPITGDIIKVQRINKSGTFTTIGKVD